MDNKAPLLMPNQHEPFNGDVYVMSEFLKLKNIFSIEVAVETGTCLGGTTKFLALNFNEVFTIEINKDYQDFAKKFILSDNVNYLLGDSAKKIKKVCKKIKGKKTIFFLDSHWQNKLPLLDELQAIADYGLRPIIAIHDFYVPDEKLGFDEWEGKRLDFNLIKSKLENIYGVGNYNYYYNTLEKSKFPNRGLIYILP